MYINLYKAFKDNYCERDNSRTSKIISIKIHVSHTPHDVAIAPSTVTYDIHIDMILTGSENVVNTEYLNDTSRLIQSSIPPP